MPQTRIGISGWTYAPWRGVFYPKELRQKDELHFASRQLPTIEINGSFYSLQRPSSYQLWYEQTPADFVFSLKGGRFITHIKRLRGVEAALANFFASGLLALKEKLGPVLWQLPPQLKYDEAVVSDFLGLLPRTAADAVKLAKKHDARMKGKTFTETDAPRRRIRHVMEVRHESFVDPSFVRLLRRHGVALCFSDSDGKWPYAEDVTADFVYARLHGAEELYASGYTDVQLDRWADRLRAWRDGSQPREPKLIAPGEKPAPRKGRDVFVYFDNDVKVHAPYDAMKLAARLGVGTEPEPPPKEIQSVTATPRTSWPGVGGKRKRPVSKRRPRRASHE